MRAGFNERPHVFADQAALADIDQLLRRLSLRGWQLVLGCHRVDVRENPGAEIGAVADLEQQLVEAVRLGRRMPVELEALGSGT